MPSSKSPPIAVADATPWTWEGAASVIEYQVRFYSDSKAVDELAQSGGARDVTITVQEREHYDAPGAMQSTEHSSTMTNTPTVSAIGGQWILLGLGNKHPEVTFVAALDTNPAGATHYRILVK